MFNNFCRKSLYIIASLLLSSTIYASEETGEVESSVLRGLEGALLAVELPLRVATERAEDRFRYESGDDTNVIDLTAGNDYIADLVICTKYWVKLTFVGARFNDGKVAGATVPLPESVFGKIIYLVPVHGDDDSMITTWECVTNFTIDNAIYQGDSGGGIDLDDGLAEDGGSATATRSILAKYTDDPILEKCIYASGDIWSGLSSAAGTCTED